MGASVGGRVGASVDGGSVGGAPVWAPTCCVHEQKRTTTAKGSAARSTRFKVTQRHYPAASADNLDPVRKAIWANIPSRWPDTHPVTAVYAPYLVPGWTRVDRSTRVMTFYYLLSTSHPPYNVQLMRANVALGAATP